MDKIFLNVLHEEEKMENVSMDMLKGGTGSSTCDNGGSFNCSGKKFVNNGNM